MLAAQLWYAALAELPDWEEAFANGEYGALLSWLRRKIHVHGSLYGTEKLVLQATGKPLSHESLIKYLKERYLPLYQG